VSRDDSFWRSVGPDTAWVVQQLGRLGVPPHILDDASADVLASAWRQWSVEQTRIADRSIRPWLMRLAADRALASLEFSSSRAGSTRSRVLRALDALPFVDRLTFLVCEIERMSDEDAVFVCGGDRGDLAAARRRARAAFVVAFDALAPKRSRRPT